MSLLLYASALGFSELVFLLAKKQVFLHEMTQNGVNAMDFARMFPLPVLPVLFVSCSYFLLLVLSGVDSVIIFLLLKGVGPSIQETIQKHLVSLLHEITGTFRPLPTPLCGLTCGFSAEEARVIDQHFRIIIERSCSL